MLTMEEIKEEFQDIDYENSFRDAIIGASFNFGNKLIYDYQKIKDKIKSNNSLEEEFKEIKEKDFNLMINFSNISEISKIDGDFLIADGYDEAIVGYTNDGRVVYDSEICINILCETGISYEESLEFLEFNTFGAYVGEKTPIFCYKVGN